MKLFKLQELAATILVYKPFYKEKSHNINNANSIIDSSQAWRLEEETLLTWKKEASSSSRYDQLLSNKWRQHSFLKFLKDKTQQKLFRKSGKVQDQRVGFRIESC